MGYIQNLERELREKLPAMDKETLIRYFKGKVLSSFLNGIKEGRNEKEAKPIRKFSRATRK